MEWQRREVRCSRGLRKLGSLLAQRADTETAAALGVYLHGLSGDTALKKCGFRGMMAGDIVNGLRDFLAENQL